MPVVGFESPAADFVIRPEKTMEAEKPHLATGLDAAGYQEFGSSVAGGITGVPVDRSLEAEAAH